ncbi:MAG: hypothetical protein MUF81_08165 [Verrucomicrobia bacterium]|jgi:hypothetical protein|nr:hypothetical protein [Verrucomicrobiota bacterium]
MKLPVSIRGFAVLMVLAHLSVVRAAEVFVPTGIVEIDAMRRDFLIQPTTPDNAARRHSLIFSWVRHLVHRGVDMAEFHEACAAFSAWGPVDPSR